MLLWNLEHGYDLQLVGKWTRDSLSWMKIQIHERHMYRCFQELIRMISITHIKIKTIINLFFYEMFEQHILFNVE